MSELFEAMQQRAKDKQANIDLAEHLAIEGLKTYIGGDEAGREKIDVGFALMLEELKPIVYAVPEDREDDAIQELAQKMRGKLVDSPQEYIDFMKRSAKEDLLAIFENEEGIDQRTLRFLIKFSKAIFAEEK